MKWVLFQDLKLVLNKTARKIERIFLTKPFFPGRGDKEEISKEIKTSSCRCLFFGTVGFNTKEGGDQLY